MVSGILRGQFQGLFETQDGLREVPDEHQGGSQVRLELRLLGVVLDKPFREVPQEVIAQEPLHHLLRSGLGSPEGKHGGGGQPRMPPVGQVPGVHGLLLLLRFFFIRLRPG